MVEIPRPKREAAPMPPAPRPASDLPAPLPPSRGRAAAPVPMRAPAPAPAPEPARMPARPLPPVPREHPLSPMPARHDIAREIEDSSGSPPVFIKIDKYTDIVKHLQKLKGYSLSLRDALDALADIEKEINTGITIAHRALDDFNTIISVLDSKITKADSTSEIDIDTPEDVDNYVKGIYDQMEKIKAELKSVEK